MALLDNAIWLTGTGGTAVSGVTTISEGGNDTTVTGTFTGDAWDATAGGSGVSDFGAFATATPIIANYDFSNAVENLSITINHVNDDGATTYDDSWTITAYDENGVQIPGADIVAGLSGVLDESVTINPDGSVSIEAAGTTINDITLDLAGPVSELDLTYEPGPNGSVTGGSGISDLSFDIPLNDVDGDGVADDVDLDSDGDGILDTDEGLSTSPPSTITITFDGDEFAAGDNTRWELRDPDGNLIASDNTTDSTVEITNVSVAGLGDYTFTVLDDFGDGIAGLDPASYTISIDGVVVLDSGANPNFGTTTTETFTVDAVVTTTDTDGDGIADHLDLDSDNDGITDNVEMQSTAGYIAPSGLDSNGDGLDDAYEGLGLIPVDTDGDGIADYLDLDTDNDGINDVDEAGHGFTQAEIDASGDTDGDGIMDAVDDVVGWDVNDADIDGSGNFTLSDSDGDTAPDGSNATPLVQNFDFRETIPCFTTGTMIATENGEVLVEDIRPGNMVLTVDNGLQPVRWVGSKTLTQVDLAEHHNLRPVVIRKKAFGNRRKMLVSPQHGLMVKQAGNESLIRAKHVAEALGGQYARIDKRCEFVTYIHIMFDQHELIYAEGAVTESFYPGPVALKGLECSTQAELLILFPDLKDVAFGDSSTSSKYGNPIRPYLLRKEARKFANHLSH
jgi:hypothetical protein